MKFLSLGSSASIHDDVRCESEVFFFYWNMASRHWVIGAQYFGTRTGQDPDPWRWDRCGGCETKPSGTVPYPARMKTSTVINVLGLEYLCKSDSIDFTVRVPGNWRLWSLFELFLSSDSRFVCVSSKLALSVKFPILFLKHSYRISIDVSAILYQIFLRYSESLCTYVEPLLWQT
jgi:hypothetical protein